MKNKMIMMLFCIASFVGFTHVKVEAVSNMPGVLVMNFVRGASNNVVLSTNTLSSLVDDDISTTGSDKQLAGFIEFSASKGTTSSADRLKITQAQPGDSTNMPSSSYWPAYLQGGGSDPSIEHDALTGAWIAINLQTNVTAASTTSYTIGDFRDINATESSSTISAFVTANPGASNTYSNQTGLLRIFIADDSGNSLADGTYEMFLVFSLSAT